VGLLVAPPIISTAQAREAASQAINETTQEITIEGTVAAVDYASRTVTLRGQQGNMVTLDVPANAPRFKQVKVGDHVTATYYDRISARLKPAGEPAVDRRVDPITTPTPGGLPGATRTRQRVTTVTITGWYPTDKVVTFVGPNNVSYSRRLLDTTDPNVLEGLKVGDRVDVTRTEAITVAVQPATPTASAQPFRSRWSIEGGIGWDVNLAGEFLNDSIGTLNNIPVVVNSTTYGDVFGTGFQWQIGLGYALDDRNELRGGFSYQTVGADVTTIGTAGTAALVATFEDYTVWSLDLGYRRYFDELHQYKIRPYAGFTLGIADIPRINGTFAAPAAGLVRYVTDLYDGTAAFTFAVNGGVIAPVSPKIDLTAQIAFRHVSGLAEIDQLAGTGLDRINDESGRWTMPITFGVRYKF
jgi:hypothetical protein